MLVCHAPNLWTMNPTFIDSCIKFSLEKIVELMYWKFRPESLPSPVVNEEVPDALFFFIIITESFFSKADPNPRTDLMFPQSLL